MLITTSRKPSQRTRTFSKSLERVLNSKSINRGKMSLRDVIIKSSQIGFNNTAIISEMKGNPSRIEIYDFNGDLIFLFDITVSISNSKGKIKKDKLRLRFDLDHLNEKLISALDIPIEDEIFRSDIQQKDNSNLLWIKKGKKGSKAVVEFFDDRSQLTGPRIYVHNCRLGK